MGVTSSKPRGESLDSEGNSEQQLPLPTNPTTYGYGSGGGGAFSGASASTTSSLLSTDGDKKPSGWCACLSWLVCCGSKGNSSDTDSSTAYTDL